MSGSQDLSMLNGKTLESELQQGVRYRIDRTLGEGGLGVVFIAVRDAPDGLAPVVIKVLRPAVVASAQGTAHKLVRKEVVALGRLNERVPQTPFVVRFIDTGSVALAAGVVLPWIAVEHVYGGLEGTTLEQRVRYSCDNTGFAFDPARAAHALRCLGAGLSAIHEVGVIHRDITPGNVLCCGFGEFEIFKISDFGLARMQSLETFGDIILGTPAYAPPEQNFPEHHGAGSYTDVFSLACVAYFLLTGDQYFDVGNSMQGLLAVKAPARKSLLDGRWLCPELRSQPATCSELDQVLSQSTSFDVMARPQHAQQLSGLLARGLGLDGVVDSSRASRRRVQSILNLPSPVEVRGWLWTIRHPPGDDIVLENTSWESDGHCLATSNVGLLYWNGTSWTSAPTDRLPQGSRPRCLHRAHVGTWLLAGDELIATYSSEGVLDVLGCPGLSFQHISGHFEDLMIAVSDNHPGRPQLWTLSGKQWRPPFELAEFASVSGLVRIGVTRWLLAGRRHDGNGMLAVCSPLEGVINPIAIPPTRAVVACASQPERELALAVGMGGVVASVYPGGIMNSLLEGQPNLSACAVDILDREWVASAGRLWVKEPGPVARFRPVWEDGRFHAPFISVMADVGLVLAMTADGGVLEGRAPWSGISVRPSRR